MNLPASAKKGLKNLLNLVYPPFCGICGKKLLTKKEENLSICADCFSKRKKNPAPYCAGCGRSLYNLAGSVEVCWECSGKTFYYERAWAFFVYEGTIKEALHRLKYSKKFSLSKLFCSLLILKLRENPEVLDKIEAVLAVPLHSAKLREREFNQAHTLAAPIVKEFKLRDITKCLKRSRATRPQSELDKKERFNNVKGAFEVTNPELVNKKNLLLIDDLFTTGATLNECAIVLKNAGAGKIHCLAFARGS
jgi:competence protein ComFC